MMQASVAVVKPTPGDVGLSETPHVGVLAVQMTPVVAILGV
jgi:hypothetical protein